MMGRTTILLMLLITPSLWAQSPGNAGRVPVQMPTGWAVRADTPLPTTAPTDGRNYYYITQNTAVGDQWFVLLAPQAQAAMDLLRRSGKVGKDAKLRVRRITHLQAMELLRDAQAAAELEAEALAGEAQDQGEIPSLAEPAQATPSSQGREPERKAAAMRDAPKSSTASLPSDSESEAPPADRKPKGHIPSPDTIVRAMPRPLLAKPAEQETELDRAERAKWVREYCIDRTISLMGTVENVKREGDHYSVIVSGPDGSPRCTVNFYVVFEFTLDARAMLMKVCVGDKAKFTGWIERIIPGANSGDRHKDGIAIEVWLSDCKLQNISAP